MAAVLSPTVRRRRLGNELRHLREQAGLTCDEVGERLEWSGAKVSRIETAKGGVHPRDVADLLDLYAVTDQQARDRLLGLAREARQRGWWRAYDDAMRAQAEMWIGLEAEAVNIRYFAALLVPGLLQTEEYARAVFRGFWPDASDEEIERRVALRMARRQILTRDQPAHLFAVIDEAALRRVVGGRAVLRRQLEHLLDVSRDLPVTLRVLPFVIGSHAGIDGGFTVLELAPPDPSVVCVESPAAIFYVEDETQVERYKDTFMQVSAVTPKPAASATLIRQIADEL